MRRTRPAVSPPTVAGRTSDVSALVLRHGTKLIGTARDCLTILRDTFVIGSPPTAVLSDRQSSSSALLDVPVSADSLHSSSSFLERRKNTARCLHLRRFGPLPTSSPRRRDGLCYPVGITESPRVGKLTVPSRYTTYLVNYILLIILLFLQLVYNYREARNNPGKRLWKTSSLNLK
ncbi:hypothetical protein PUN28_019717 [Cardiocondyla obscurior]|uniref:Uncharacterized protein n=1 Tax=Cardiocondyla obscurior TaxID=286306 RepID=A0AAW2EE43_9HYME